MKVTGQSSIFVLVAAVGLFPLVCPQSVVAGETNFYCRYKPPGVSYWDQLMFYEDSGENAVRKVHPVEADGRYSLVHFGEQDELLFAVYRHATDRSSYTIYTYNLQTQEYIQSHAHYVTHQSYYRDFRETLTEELERSFYQPELFALIPEKPAEGEIPIGWNKTRWICEEISAFRYFREYLRMFFISVASSIS